MAWLRLLIGFAAVPWAAWGCTYFEVKCPENLWVIGRTMELGGGGGGRRLAADGAPRGEDARWNVNVHPRGADGMFTNKYGYVGVDSSVHPAWNSSDGMNEVGLTVSAHTMRSAQYETAEAGKLALSIYDVVNFLLGQFDSVASAEQGLANVTVVSDSLSRDDFMHWGLADASGASAVLEYVGGQRRLHVNHVRVMTNDPDFQWHLKNLNMYVGLSHESPSGNDDVAMDSEVGQVPQIWSQGFNLLGLPGDFSPAARFVRAFYLRQYAVLREPVASVEDGLVLSTGLLNNVFIPRGTVAPTSDGPHSLGDFDFTQYALMKVPGQLRFLFRTYRNMGWREVDLKGLDFSRRSTLPMADGTLGIQDVTRKLQPQLVAV